MNNKIRYDNLIEVLLIVYLFIGMMTYPLFRYSRYVISLIIQLRIFYKSRVHGIPVKKCAIPAISYSIIVLIGICFFFIGVSFVNWINRILPLFSIFGLSWLLLYKDKIRFNKVLAVTIKLYKYLAIVIIIDAIVFEISGFGIWKPIIYMSHRFAGPFYDCNYMGMTYAFLFLIYWFNTSRKKNRISTFVIFAIMLWLSGSWSAIIIGLGVLMFNCLFTIKHLFLKQIIFLAVYYGISLWIFNNANYAMKIFVDTAKVLMPFDSESLAVKFGSLLIRIDTQISAINYSFNQLIGYGPRTILQFFKHDTHNSYVAILFETGLLGLILLLINMPRKSNSKLLDATSSFIILSAFVLDIHYTVIYSLFLLLVVFEQNQQKSYATERKRKDMQARLGVVNC